MENAPAVTRPFRLDANALAKLLDACSLVDDWRWRGGSADVAERLDDYLVAREGERLVGAIGLAYQGDTALVEALAVAATGSGRGLEEVLIEAALADVVRHGVRRVAIRADAAPALLARLGFGSLSSDEEGALAALRRHGPADRPTAVYLERRLA